MRIATNLYESKVFGYNNSFTDTITPTNDRRLILGGASNVINSSLSTQYMYGSIIASDNCYLDTYGSTKHLILASSNCKASLGGLIIGSSSICETGYAPDYLIAIASDSCDVSGDGTMLIGSSLINVSEDAYDSTVIDSSSSSINDYVRNSTILCSSNSKIVGTINTSQPIYRATIFGGEYLNVNSSYSVALAGKYNNHNSDDVLTIGWGSSEIARANLFKISNNGNASLKGTLTQNTNADYAEYFEWKDSNPNSEDRVGRFVTLDGDKIQLADSTDDYIVGVISGAPAICGDGAEDVWSKMVVTDIYGRPQFETIHHEEVLDDKGKVISPAHDTVEFKVNPDYDPSKEYIPRSKRPEWATVGMMGKLIVIDDGTCEVNGYATVSDKGDGTATAATPDSLDKYRVLSRLDETHVKVLFR